MTLIKKIPKTSRVAATIVGIMLLVKIAVAAQLNDEGRVDWATKEAPPELICEMPLLWVSPRINLPMARIPMVVEEEAVFTGSETIAAIDRQTGELLWSYYTGDIDFNNMIGSNGVQALAVDDKQVYFGGSLKTLYALDRHTGALRWQFATPGYILEHIAQDEQRVYMTSNGTLYAINKADGNLAWQLDFEIPVSSPIFENHMVYVAGMYAAYAITADNGNITWETEIDTSSHLDLSYTSPYIYQNQFLFSAFNGEILSVDIQTGELLWRFSSTATSAPIRITNGNNNRVILNNVNNLIALFDLQTQKPLWWFRPYAGKNYMPPKVYNNLLLVGNESYFMTALDLDTGEEVFRMPITPDIEGIRIIEVRDGIIYFSSPKGRIMAYRFECPQLLQEREVLR